MQKGINKKGQDLSIGTLILIVLGIIVLVLLVLGFSLGWGNLWEKINIFGGGNSIGDVVTACNLAGTQGGNGVYGYCQDFKKVKVDGKTEYVNCLDTRVDPSLTNKLQCEPAIVTQAEVTLCTNLKKQGQADTKINGAAICNQLVPDCVTKLDECQAADPTDSTKCTDSCEIKTSTPAPPAEVKTCELKANAADLCKVKTNKDECNNLLGCEYTGK